MSLLRLVLLLGLVSSCISGHKILLVPGSIGSHVVMQSHLAVELMQAGHEVHVVKHESLPVLQMKKFGIKYMNFYKVKGEQHWSLSKEHQDQSLRYSQLPVHEFIGVLRRYFWNICSDIMGNERLIQQLEKENYDFAVVDEFPSMLCFHALPHRLDIPYGSLVVVVPPINLFSQLLQTTYLTPNMPFIYMPEPNFLVRLGQFFAIRAFDAFITMERPDALLWNFTRNRPVKYLNELRENSKIWFVDQEPLIDVPRQTPPNLIYTGCFSAGPPNPLVEDIQKWADSSEQGLIVVSYGGSMLSDFPKVQTEKLMRALGSMKYNVIMRLKKQRDIRIPSNVKIVDWLAQNDILGHANTVLFITHCGASSMNEAVYHGVPMVAFPYQAEQLNNARKVQGKKYGIYLDRDTFTSEELVATVQKILEAKPAAIVQSVKKASSIIKSRPMTARQTAVYWIEHVIKYGGDHLKPFTSTMAWYEILMLDIMAAILSFALVILFVMYKCFKCFICGKCCKRRGEKQKTT